MDTNQIKKEILEKIKNAETSSDIEQIRIYTLGKQGVLTNEFKNLSQLEGNEKKSRGQKLNDLKNELTSAIENKMEELESKELNEKLKKVIIDITLPTYDNHPNGRIHPITQTINEITTIFADMGFSIAEGPQIEDDYHNFEALNLPPHHPARDMQDTFYLKNGNVLRTHTSSVQIREMSQKGVPIKIISPGRTYRYDSDQTHSPMFHQFEGLVIDKNINMGHLKGCLQEFCEAYFETKNIPLRFRANYFPYTEPSAEVDIGCTFENGDFIIKEGGNWMEILGCGMVHPNVLKNCGINPDEYQGFAFGTGIERIAMLKYGIRDIRSFHASDLRWIKHYGFLPFEVPNNSEGLSS
jgi:phenylalanyl-tRNA synthetase alpha chain